MSKKKMSATAARHYTQRIIQQSTHMAHVLDNIGNHSIVTLLRKFKDITVEKIFSPDTVKHNVTHVIETKGAPVTSKTRRLSTEKLKIAKDQFEVCGTITQTFQ
ncbi:hypothetical protein PPYR_05205 [Photinus pyralis]|uniref:Uncharacterized protein n=1 Tax=Photinus pyralis TaxID=7054 RepID=A0A5N4B0H8_PHOPY|nr:hypothetical protein PPYR_05204 [Photinus pyralis]KAB0803019.1 hypothetical protein PPYR_05205 [Photinus pyralis]